MRWLIVPLLVLLATAACAAPTPTATPAPPPAPTSTSLPPNLSSSGETASVTLAVATDESDMLRKLAFSYWDAFNAYDVEKALSYLEGDYRVEREAQIRADIGRIKTFGVKLGVSEAAPPQMVGEGQWEMYLNMKEPLGTRRIRMAFRQVDGDWRITYAQEVK